MRMHTHACMCAQKQSYTYIYVLEILGSQPYLQFQATPQNTFHHFIFVCPSTVKTLASNSNNTSTFCSLSCSTPQHIWSFRAAAHVPLQEQPPKKSLGFVCSPLALRRGHSHTLCL